VMLVVVSIALPRRTPQSGATRQMDTGAENKDLGKLLVAPITWLFMLSVATLNASHAYYYVFSVRYWAEVQHFDKVVTGYLFAMGVVVEVALMWVIGDNVPIRRAKQLMIVAGIGGTIRWLAMAFTPPLWLLFPLQALHATTYAAMHLGAMFVLRQAIPPRVVTTVMGIYAALVNGVVIGLVQFNLDPVYAHYGVHGYVLMALLSLVGGVGVTVFCRIWRGGEFSSQAADSIKV
ncbi:MAG: MFS transporter, partial [Alphaproteobacteria bacterium]|nr:MFS transporter [Alphaproteobacteria bacterium]